jgi:hypothetical protein
LNKKFFKKQKFKLLSRKVEAKKFILIKKRRKNIEKTIGDKTIRKWQRGKSKAKILHPHAILKIATFSKKIDYFAAKKSK